MKSRFHIDWWLLSPALILVTTSLTTLFSINVVYFKTQLISLFIAILAFLFFSRISLDFLRRLKFIIYIISLVLFFVLLIIGIETRGAVRWFEIFGVNLQLSEILKPFLAISLASYLSESKHSRAKTFIFALIFLLPVFFLITLQPDLGTGLIYALVGVFTLFASGFPVYLFGLTMILLFILTPFIWTLLRDYQKQRILTFVHPTVDPLGTSYNSIQAIIAVGSGAIFGRGWFQGTQSSLRFLPEQHTDFIFATIAEGLGFIGATIVVFIFSLLCFRVYHVFKNAKVQFDGIYAICCFGFFFIQGFVNIFMNVGLLPVVGITLPFVSYGGNSLIANFIFLGILANIRRKQTEKQVLEIR